jgi:hypothetical protein
VTVWVTVLVLVSVGGAVVVAVSVLGAAGCPVSVGLSGAVAVTVWGS